VAKAELPAVVVEEVELFTQQVIQMEVLGVMVETVSSLSLLDFNN